MRRAKSSWRWRTTPAFRTRPIFRGKILTYYGRWTYKIEEARRQGAAGILMIHTHRERHLSLDDGPVRLDRPADQAGDAARLAGGGGVAAARGRRRLFQQGGQDLGRLTDAAAAKRGFKPVPLGLTLDATVRSTIQRSETENVLGRWPGKGPLAREAVLIGGHYDHFGIAAPVDGDSIYNGAEDNASGTAGVLAAAEAFVRSGVRTWRARWSSSGSRRRNPG